MKADLTLSEFPGRAFTGTLARTAQSIDVASRTLLTEIDVDNAKGELLPGSYARGPPQAAGAQRPRSSCRSTRIIFRTEGCGWRWSAATAKSRLQPITLGRDYGNSLEVVSGLSGTRADHRQPAGLDRGGPDRPGGGGKAQ